MVRRHGRTRRRYVRRRQVGANIFKKIWSGIKSAAKPIGKFIKDQKLISKGLNTFLPGPVGKVAGAAASQLGYGRRRRRRTTRGTRQRGGAIRF